MMTHEDKTMLALAALTYRGFGLHSEAAIHDRLRPWLPKVENEGLGHWDLVWGPATFRAATSVFDDAMMYVVKQALPAGERPRYAIAIRGTNPVSAFDWVFGDFWVQLQIDQPPPCTPPARLSGSTALGIAILKQLAAEDPPSELHLLAPLGSTLANALRDLAPAELDPADILPIGSGFLDSHLVTRLDALRGRSGAALQGRVFDRLATLLDPAATIPAVDRSVYELLLRNVQATSDRGERLSRFLDRVVERGARLAVTGHSKGGALALATALWLEESWASSRDVEISCFSFAGPTAGNGAFARRYDERLATRTRRIVNRRDVVPHAWVPSELTHLADVYPALAIALKGLATSVALLDYAHVGGELIEVPSEPRPGTLVENLVHHHLDAYLAAAPFTGAEWRATSIFLEP